MKFKSIVSILVTFALLIGAFFVAPFEVGAAYDSFAAAKTISIGTRYYDQIDKDESRDYYKFSLPSSGKLTVNASIAFLSNTYIHNSNQKCEWSNSNQEITEDIELLAGTYYLEIERNSWGNHYGNYNFRLTFTSANETFKETQTSNNNSFTNASNISLGTNYYGHIARNDTVDYYKFILPSSGKLTVNASISFLSNTYIHNSNQKCEWSNSNQEITEDIELLAGTYYLEIERNSWGNHYGNYNFRLTFTSANETFKETQTSNNNSFTNASNISLGTNYYGHIARNDIVDYYKFSLSSSGKLTVNASISFLSNAYIYDSNQNYKWSSSKQVITEDIELLAGTYYLKIERNSWGNHYGNYNFILSLSDNSNYPTSVSLSKTSATIYVGETALLLNATVYPSDVIDKTITWLSSNTSVARVSSGYVTAVAAGSATITAKTSNGKTATCEFMVYPQPIIRLKQDTNQYSHYGLENYNISNKNYRDKLYWDSLNTWDHTFKMHDLLHTDFSKDPQGVCHGIALSICYAKNGNLDLNALNNGKQTSNYWDLGSFYNSNRTKFKDLVIYYNLTQLTANGAESYSVSKNGWHVTDLSQRLKEFLKKFKQDAEKAQIQKKPIVLGYRYSEQNENESGHSVVVCGYNYNSRTKTYDITIYDENIYPQSRYLTFSISSDYSSFEFTDANGEVLNNVWTTLKVYDLDKLYSQKDYTSISVVKGSEPVSANNITDLNVTAGKKFKVTNADGQYLEYNGNSYRGTMQVYNCTLVDNLDGTSSWRITVDKSSKFVFANLENDCKVIGETTSGGFYFACDNVNSLEVNQKNITVKGQSYIFDVAFQPKNGMDIIRMSGNSGGSTVLSDNNNTIDVSSNQNISNTVVTSYKNDEVKVEKVNGTVKTFQVKDSTGELVTSGLSIMYGDATGDGKIDMYDVIRLNKYLAKFDHKTNTSPIQIEKGADVTGDGKIDMYDVIRLNKYLAKYDHKTNTSPIKLGPAK